MKQLFIKQKVFSLRGRFSVLDRDGHDVYFVEGSFMQIPKNYTITNVRNEEIARITKKIFSFLPTFYVEQQGREIATIKKEFTLFKARYSIDAAGLTVQGNWWDLNFDILQNGQKVASIQKVLLSWGDTYQVEIYDESLEPLVISIVVAIDCVKADNAAAAAAST